MSDTNLNLDDLHHIAKLSRLEINPQEENQLLNQLAETASYINVLQELDTSSVYPTSEVETKKNTFRIDEILPSLSQKEALSGAKSPYQGYFKTKATIKK